MMQWMMTQLKPAALALMMMTGWAGSPAAMAAVDDAEVGATQDEQARMAVLEVEHDIKGKKAVRRFRMALDGRHPSNLELNDDDASFDITLIKRDDDGAHADLQMHLRYTERRERDTWRASFSNHRRLKIGQPTVISAVEGKRGGRLKVTVTLR